MGLRSEAPVGFGEEPHGVHGSRHHSLLYASYSSSLSVREECAGTGVKTEAPYWGQGEVTAAKLHAKNPLPVTERFSF